MKIALGADSVGMALIFVMLILIYSELRNSNDPKEMVKRAKEVELILKSGDLDKKSIGVWSEHP
jgi:hypothetical protein